MTGCYYNSLIKAVESGARSVAFPSISTGAYGYPVEKAATVAVETVKQFLNDNPGTIDTVIWTLLDEKTKNAYDEALA